MVLVRDLGSIYHDFLFHLEPSDASGQEKGEKSLPDASDVLQVHLALTQGP